MKERKFNTFVKGEGVDFISSMEIEVLFFKEKNLICLNGKIFFL